MNNIEFVKICFITHEKEIFVLKNKIKTKFKDNKIFSNAKCILKLKF